MPDTRRIWRTRPAWPLWPAGPALCLALALPATAAPTAALAASAAPQAAPAPAPAAAADPGSGSFESLRASFQPSETLVLDRQGQPIHRLRRHDGLRRGQWVALPDISPALLQALLLSEDKRFYEHSGVDWRAVSAAAWGRLWHGSTRGASTLTMQLAGLLDEDLRLGSGGRSLRQKIGQAMMARRLEARWRKDQILEAYLNLVPFRGELSGIDALSRTLFAKAPHGLQDSEAAIAAALVRAPNAPPARVAARACGVLKAMRGAQAATDCLALDMQTEAALARRAWPASQGQAPHLARHLLAQARSGQGSAPATLRSTLDGPLQRLAASTLQRHVRELRGRNVADGAVIVLDNASGQVLAWVGSTGSLSQAPEVDGVLARRQPGSTLKPFLYAQALAEKRITAASLLDDSPQQLPTGSGLYIPQNYDHRFKGWVSARTALAASLNLPAVRTLVMVSPAAFRRQLNALGLQLRQSGGYYGYSLALGSAEVSLLHLSNAYRTLAQGGRHCPIRLTLPASATASNPANACTQALDAGAAFITGDILSDRNARAPTFGADSVLATPFWSAVKTGTSKDMRDNWAIGWSARYTVGVWIGNASGAPMWDVSGTSGAAPVWASLMRALHAGAPPPAPHPPPGLQHIRVHFGPHHGQPLEAPRQEWFLPGTAQPLFAPPGTTADTEDPRHASQNASAPAAATPTSAPARIQSPAEGTILALDPDIPPRHQRLTLQASPGHQPPATLRWSINRHPLARGPQAQWLPRPGRHTIQLHNAQGQLQDQRHIEVRGAQTLPAKHQKR